jgi:alkanesulfonate monooxygenase SsuD/methylene tetrahydromethanopterin reductase-like flavin-dependent oxidoreductase (luciferase family)
VDVSTSAASGRDPVRAAQAAEALGFDFVSASDHLHGVSPTYETWTMLAWIAASTSRIGVLTRVLGLPYRNPAVLAKMAETFDRLSEGRLILGLGAGASDGEFRGFGLDVRPPRDKVDGLAEAIHIIRGVWTQPSFTFTGRLYRTDAAELTPKPDHRIPIWLGTFGNRALDVTGRLADGWIPSLGYAAPEQLQVMRGRTLAAAQAAGRDPAEVTCALNLQIRLQDQPGTDPAVVCGPPQAVTGRLLELAAMGFNALNLIVTGSGGDQLERIARDVIPAVRSALSQQDRADVDLNVEPVRHPADGTLFPPRPGQPGGHAEGR